MILCVSVPLPPTAASCGQLTNSSVEVAISPPSVPQSTFDIDLYEVTYSSVIEEFLVQKTLHSVAYADNNETVDSLWNATAGITYSVTVVSRSGHRRSQSVMTRCTAGWYCFVMQCDGLL